MTKRQVKIGGRYIAKVSDRLVTVRITGESVYGGYDAVNETTGRRIHLRTAARLRRPAPDYVTNDRGATARQPAFEPGSRRRAWPIVDGVRQYPWEAA